MFVFYWAFTLGLVAINLDSAFVPAANVTTQVVVAGTIGALLGLIARGRPGEAFQFAVDCRQTGRQLNFFLVADPMLGWRKGQRRSGRGLCRLG